MTKKVYPIGSFGGTWRDDLIQNLPDLSFDDPREHDQSAVAKLDFSDMNSAMECPISVVYLANGKRAGTTSYCELGASRARGNCIIVVDENEKKDLLIEKIASHHYSNLEEAKYFLKKGEFIEEKNLPIAYENKTLNSNPCEKVLFTGNLEEMTLLMNNVSNNKKVYTNPIEFGIQNFTNNFDIVIANFKKGEAHDKEALYHMGIAYATGVPIILLEGNIIPYPTLPGLARRTFIGENKLKIAEDYLTALKSQHISDEALVCYELFKKYNN